MQTILKAGGAIGACGTFAVFEIIMACSKLKQGRQAEYDRLTALLGEPGRWAMSGSMTLACPRGLATRVAR
jgi:hypothetical protein